MEKVKTHFEIYFFESEANLVILEEIIIIWLKQKEVKIKQ